MHWHCLHSCLVLFLLLLLTHPVCLCRPWNVRPNASSWVFLFSGQFCLISPLVHFKNSPEYVTRLRALAFITLMGFPLYRLVSSSFLFLLWYSFLIFFYLHLFYGFCFKYSQVFVSLFFSEHSDFCLVW